MQTIRNLVCLSVLGALWLNGSVPVNLDLTFSFSATALILLAIFRQQSMAAGFRSDGCFLKAAQAVFFTRSAKNAAAQQMRLPATTSPTPFQKLRDRSAPKKSAQKTQERTGVK